VIGSSRLGGESCLIGRARLGEPKSRFQIGRFVVALIAAPILSLLFAGLVTFDSLGYWGNFVTQLAAFLTVAIVVSRIDPVHGAWALTIGLGIIWGTIALVVGVRSLTKGGPLAAPIVTLTYVVAAIALSWWLQGRR
jgi:hypothetical protein